MTVVGHTRELRGEIVRVNPRSNLNVACRAPDWPPVLAYLGTRGDPANGQFVSGRHGLPHLDSLAADLHLAARLEGEQGHRHVVGGVNEMNHGSVPGIASRTRRAGAGV